MRLSPWVVQNLSGVLFLGLREVFAISVVGEQAGAELNVASCLFHTASWASLSRLIQFFIQRIKYDKMQIFLYANATAIQLIGGGFHLSAKCLAKMRKFIARLCNICPWNALELRGSIVYCIQGF